MAESKQPYGEQPEEMFPDLSPGLSHAQHCSPSRHITEKGKAQTLTCDSPS